VHNKYILFLIFPLSPHPPAAIRRHEPYLLTIYVFDYDSLARNPSAPNSSAIDRRTSVFLKMAAKSLSSQGRHSSDQHLVNYQTEDGAAFNNSNVKDDCCGSLCAIIITIASLLLMLITLPISIWMSIKIVYEYQRVVLFRLGRVRAGGAQGPGLFFIIPCIDAYLVSHRGNQL